MTTSATTTFDLSLTDAVEEAFERAGSEARSGYDLRTARRSLNLLLTSWANRGLNLWTVASDTISLVAGTATYAVPDQAVDLLEHLIRTGAGTSQNDISMTRISVSAYAAIPNKNAVGKPLQILVTRGQAGNTVTVWPTPDSSTTYTLAFWYMRRMYDAGPTGVNTNDVPYRFLPALVAGLAYYIARKIPEGQARLDGLKKDYEEEWQMAADEDHDKASVRFVPRIGLV